MLTTSHPLPKVALPRERGRLPELEKDGERDGEVVGERTDMGQLSTTEAVQAIP